MQASAWRAKLGPKGAGQRLFLSLKTKEDPDSPTAEVICSDCKESEKCSKGMKKGISPPKGSQGLWETQVAARLLVQDHQGAWLAISVYSAVSFLSFLFPVLLGGWGRN